ncbi:MAG: ABC transporter ATP-binding protein [Methermicoccaceae archaeon]
MIDIRNATFYYSDTNTPALKDVNLHVDEGEFVLITGASGSGKSTLARCLNGLVPHFYGGRIKGNMVVCGLDVMESSTKELAQRVGMVFQDPENQLISTDPEREIAFGLENLAFSRSMIARRIEEALDAVGIVHLRSKRPNEMSGGEKQKVAIASVLALHPEVLVLDEPTSELDPKGAEDVLKVVEQINDELGITVVLIEHRLDRVVHLVDRIVVMDKGSIIKDGTAQEVMGDRRISNTGVGIPPIIELVMRLHERGTSVSSVPLTVKESRKILRPIFRQAGAQSFEPNDQHEYGSELVSMKDVWFSYDEHAPALKGVNLSIREGEFVAILGRNASGKTTLLKHLIGLNTAQKGKVNVCGLDARNATVAQLAQHVGFVFQNPNDHLFADTVADEIRFPLKNLGYQKEGIEERVDEVLRMLEIEQYKHTYPRSLSGGEKQRVAIASVLAFKPKILVLDEPTRGLDHRLKTNILHMLDEYRGKGRAIVYSTHDVETVAECADRVIIMSDGGVVVDAPKREALSRALLFSPQINRLVQAFEKYGAPTDLLTVDEAMEVLR